MRSKILGFAPTLITLLVALAVLAYGHFWAGATAQSQHLGKIDNSKGVTSIRPAEAGSYVVHFADNRLVKFGPFGDRLWEVTPSTPAGSPEIVDIAADSDGSILALGVLPASATMALYRISRDGSDVTLVNRYPGLDAGWIAISPAGTVYLTAFHRAKFLNVLHHRARLPSEYIEQPIQQLDDAGQIVRSLGSLRHSPSSLDDFGDFLQGSISRRLLFSPDGSAYLLDADQLELERLDLETGELTGRKHRLASGGLHYRSLVTNAQFISDSTLVYNLHHMAKPFALDRRGRLAVGQVVGWEVRIAELTTGSSQRIAAGEPLKASEAIHFPDLETVKLIQLVGSASKAPRGAWLTSDLLDLIPGRRMQDD